MIDPSLRLRNAIIEGNLFIVTRLLKRFPDLIDNTNPENGWSNLHYSSYYDRYEISDHLLQLIWARSLTQQLHPSSSSSSLKSSSSSTNNPQLTLRSSSYTQITSEDEIKLTFEKDTVIHTACSNNASKTLLLLLNYFNVCIDQRGRYGFTPSHICCTKDYPSCLEILLKNGAYPNIQDDNGNTPLHLSLQYEFMDCCELLVSYKADGSMLNNEGWEPIDIAYSYDTQMKYQELKSKPPVLYQQHLTTPNIPYTAFGITNGNPQLQPNNHFGSSSSPLQKSSNSISNQRFLTKANSPMLSAKISLPTIKRRKYSLSSMASSEDENGNSDYEFNNSTDFLENNSNSSATTSSKNTRSSSPIYGLMYNNNSQSSTIINVHSNNSSSSVNGIMKSTSLIGRRKTPPITLSIPTLTSRTSVTQLPSFSSNLTMGPPPQLPAFTSTSETNSQSQPGLGSPLSSQVPFTSSLTIANVQAVLTANSDSATIPPTPPPTAGTTTQSPASKRSSMSRRTFRSNSQVSDPSPIKTTARRSFSAGSKPMPTSTTASSITTPKMMTPTPTGNSVSSSTSSVNTILSQQQSQPQPQPQLTKRESSSSSISQASSVNSTPHHRSSFSSHLEQQPPASASASLSSHQHHTLALNRSFSSSSEIDEATSKLNDFRLKNDNRVKLGLRLTNNLNNNTQNSIISNNSNNTIFNSRRSTESTISAEYMNYPNTNNTSEDTHFSATSADRSTDGSANGFTAPGAGSLASSGPVAGGDSGISKRSRLLSIPIASLRHRKES